MIFKWDKTYGLLDDKGSQQLIIIATNCTKKFRNMAGRLLAEKLNAIERTKEIAAKDR